MTTDLANRGSIDATVLEKVLIQGDLSKLTPQERLMYYNKVCDSLGLNPFTRPFDYIVLNNKLTLYAKRDCTDQLRKIHSISVKITSREPLGDIYVVTAQGTNREGRYDESIGAVNVANLRGDHLANALMKAETKAKRRVTLSLAGLGWLDETEADSIPDSRIITNDEDLNNDKSGGATDGAQKPLSRAQAQRISDLYGRLGLTKEDMLLIMESECNRTVESVTKLTSEEADKVIDALEENAMIGEEGAPDGAVEQGGVEQGEGI